MYEIERTKDPQKDFYLHWGCTIFKNFFHILIHSFQSSLKFSSVSRQDDRGQPYIQIPLSILYLSRRVVLLVMTRSVQMSSSSLAWYLTFLGCVLQASRMMSTNSRTYTFVLLSSFSKCPHWRTLTKYTAGSTTTHIIRADCKRKASNFSYQRNRIN